MFSRDPSDKWETSDWVSSRRVSEYVSMTSSILSSSIVSSRRVTDQSRSSFFFFSVALWTAWQTWIPILSVIVSVRTDPDFWCLLSSKNLCSISVPRPSSWTSTAARWSRLRVAWYCDLWRLWRSVDFYDLTMTDFDTTVFPIRRSKRHCEVVHIVFLFFLKIRRHFGIWSRLGYFGLIWFDLLCDVDHEIISSSFAYVAFLFQRLFWRFTYISQILCFSVADRIIRYF